MPLPHNEQPCETRKCTMPSVEREAMSLVDLPPAAWGTLFDYDDYPLVLYAYLCEFLC